MNVYIPIVEGQVMHKSVEDSILNQSIMVSLHKVYGPGNVNSSRNYTRERIIEEAKCREKCREMAIVTGDTYAVIQDYDCKQLDAENYLNMMAFLESNPDYGAIASGSGLAMLQDRSHICIICVMYRTDTLEKIKFHNKYGKCLCREVTEDIKSIGKKFDYMNSTKMVQEVLVQP
jgi:hypothetical protein